MVGEWWNNVKCDPVVVFYPNKLESVILNLFCVWILFACLLCFGVVLGVLVFHA